MTELIATLQWRHNERDGVSKHRRLDCLLNRLFRRRSKKNIKVPGHWPLWGEFSGDRWIVPLKGPVTWKMFPIWWRHHVVWLIVIRRTYVTMVLSHSIAFTLFFPNRTTWCNDKPFEIVYAPFFFYMQLIDLRLPGWVGVCFEFQTRPGSKRLAFV